MALTKKQLTHLLMIVFCQLLLIPFATVAQDAVVVEEAREDERPSCRVCGMWIDQYERTAGTVIYQDGSKEFTCGVACALREVDEVGGPGELEAFLVRDWNTGEDIDGVTAHYVIGSDLIPDMMPNYIAFETRREAEAFAAEHGGEVITFQTAMEDLSPRGNTVPFRIRTAVTPPQGVIGTAPIYGYLRRDRVKVGSNISQSGTNFIRSNPAQPAAPESIQVNKAGWVLNYSLTDRLAVFLNIPWFDKRLERQVRDFRTGTIRMDVRHSSGIGDIPIEFRYNLWRNDFADKFFTILLGTSLPTGYFDNRRVFNPIAGREIIDAPPSMHIGKGTATFKGGLLYSERWKDFWMHLNAIYQVNPENSDDYAFGDQLLGGIALHYTPNYDLLVGIEADAAYAQKNEDRGIPVDNTGGVRSNVAFVLDWRFLNAFGGNFKLRSSVGLPVYEDLNFNPVRGPRGPFTQAQLGGGFFANLAISFSIRPGPAGLQEIHDH